MLAGWLEQLGGETPVRGYHQPLHISHIGSGRGRGAGNKCSREQAWVFPRNTFALEGSTRSSLEEHYCVTLADRH